MAEMPEVGSIAPQLRLQTSVGDTVDLNDYRGRAVVLFFFPKASTPG
jgi:peroxiredoxin Q/BCP